MNCVKYFITDNTLDKYDLRSVDSFKANKLNVVSNIEVTAAFSIRRTRTIGLSTKVRRPPSIEANTERPKLRIS